MLDLAPHPEWPPSLPWLIALWLAAIGAAIGSFLNVVVYRLPRGISLVHPGSRCPSCGHAICWHDNVPVLGWLLLKGRCRDCRARISPRYPLIEALVGLVFVALAACEFYAGDPVYDPTDAGRVVGAMTWGRIAWHAILVCTLLAAGLMELDRQRPPLKLFLPALLVGVAAPLVWPELRTLRLMDPLPPDLAPDSHWLAALETLAGIGAGVGFGCLAWPATGLGWSKSSGRWMATVEFMLVGCYLGWQMVPLGSFAMFAYLAALMRGNRWDGPTSYDNLSLPMAAASLLGIASQRRLATLHSTAELLTTFIVFGILMAAGSLVVRYTAHRRRASRLGKLSRK